MRRPTTPAGAWVGSWLDGGHRGVDPDAGSTEEQAPRRDVEVAPTRLPQRGPGRLVRHLAGTLAASTGASTKEVMYRLGHATHQAALRYQHATRHRDRAIADALDDLLRGRG